MFDSRFGLVLLLVLAVALTAMVTNVQAESEPAFDDDLEMKVIRRNYAKFFGLDGNYPRFKKRSL
ncbi:hypothetical protein Ciccas_009939 [Cichlidogyrus casuarinus]|uniref:Uncharacterized protein n=1 Tax=Cichlidogyrus casuarinus TaxID=1844966 RepID=A0ABD2PVL5_9PLAT